MCTDIFRYMYIALLKLKYYRIVGKMKFNLNVGIKCSTLVQCHYCDDWNPPDRDSIFLIKDIKLVSNEQKQNCKNVI